MAVKTKGKTLGDLLVYELNHAYTREQYTLRNTTGSTVGLSDPMGYPLKFVGGKMELAVAGDEATVDGVLLTEAPIEAVATATDFAGGKRAVLERGPAILRKEAIPTIDAEGAAFNMTNLIARLLAIGILVKPEPATQQTQVS